MEYIEGIFWRSHNIEVRFQCREFYLSVQQLLTKQHVTGTFLTLEQTNMPSAWMLTFEKLSWMKRLN